MAPKISIAVCCAIVALGILFGCRDGRSIDTRTEVTFWHFWGGADRSVVESIVDRFNDSQEEYWVKPIAMPGNNLDLKLFLAVTGGDPPDLVNQDDPILADWAERGAIMPLSSIATDDELQRLEGWLYPAAVQLGSYRGQWYGLCNGIDIRALYYNRTLLDEFGLSPPRTLADLDHIASVISPPHQPTTVAPLGFLPNPKNLWSWGVVFGGSFYDHTNEQLTLSNPQVVEALEWMAGYGERYGDAAISYRAHDQSLPGKSFPLLAGRYAMVVDGQWRVRDILAANAAERSRGAPVTEYGVCSLPPPEGGRHDAGWVNGNFFIIPRGAQHQQGAWEFMKFWIGFEGNVDATARTCIQGGWIPVSPTVANSPVFAGYLKDHPLFATFVKLAASPNQIPRPNIVQAQTLDRELRNAASTAIYKSTAGSPGELLQAAEERIQNY